MALNSGKRSRPPAFSWERGHLGRYFSGRDARAPKGGVNAYKHKSVNYHSEFSFYAVVLAID